ncbi:ribosome-associated translation inhibitor RaiA [Seongchinamella unica]|uniref:Ribosome hibernation promoting factor n=1 Tax=Seongchinamella unica TaxID=2547392 RepID=A0A4R5LTW7_9GAMM|nr:ribosome-associated translation inhibitor RaiA [Seongchinamella unica]TDG14771.1 ribosome-associated translation inhibitor RaiA [Seongchinamella unica]
MQLNVSGHHVEVTDPLREYVETKFERLQRHFDQITNTDVTLIVEKMVQKAEATVHISGADLFAQAESEDMYAAIDALTDKLDRQLIKHKEKSRGH